jgi:hypothetical protein
MNRKLVTKVTASHPSLTTPERAKDGAPKFQAEHFWQKRYYELDVAGWPHI